MAKTWILVADSSQAKIFTVDKPLGPLEKLDTLDHPAGRQHEQQLTSDLPGRSFDISGQGRHAMEESTAPKEQEAINFAKEIGSHLEAARNKGDFTKLVMVSGPAFLGLLRKNLSAETMKLVTDQVDKNLVQQESAEIRTHLPERL